MSSSKTDEAVPILWHTGVLSDGLPANLAHSRPANPVSDTPISALIDIDTLRILLDELTQLVNMPTALIDLEGNILQAAGWQRACTGFHRAQPNSCANCIESDLFLASHLRKGEFVDYRCKNGLWDVVTPVFVGEQHLGNLYCGQFFYDDDEVDEAYFIAQARHFGYDEVDYLAAIREMPRFSRQRVRQVMGLVVGLASYLSHLSLTNLRLDESRGLIEALLNTLPDPVWLKNAEGVFIVCNEAFGQMLGASVPEILGKTDDDFLPPDLAEFFRQKDREAMAAGEARVNEEWLPHAEKGERILLETIKTPLPGTSGKPIGVLGIGRDMTERKRIENRLHLMSRVFYASGEAILITDAKNRILAVNPAFTQLTGYPPEEVIGRDPRMLSAGSTPHEVYEEMWSMLARTDHWQGELWDRRKSGEPYPKRLSISVVRDSQEQIVNYIGAFEDITERKAAEDKIRYLAHHDALTGLPNRFSLYERVEQGMAFARRFQTSLAVMLIDLDHFKKINDTLGHNVGDQLLVQVARRLEHSVRESDIVARLGGDEFVVVLSAVECVADIAEVAAQIVGCLAAPFAIGDHELRTSPSIGISFYPDDASNIADLIKNADVAMYHAKERGRSNYQMYTESMRNQFAQRLDVEKELETALDQGQFVLHYQPQIDLATQQVVGVEALLRWQHPTRGLLLPAEFIACAEETRLILPLGVWVLNEACQQLQRWRAVGLPALGLAINLSALQFEDPQLPARIDAALSQSGFPAEGLSLEITESMAMNKPEHSERILWGLRGIGVRLVLDDFGTGHSSLAYLKRFPIAGLKIDRSFVRDIETDANDAGVCEITLLLATKLGLTVVAEGVETESQRSFLAQLGCQQAQGFLFCPALPAAELPDFIAHFPRASPGDPPA